MSLRRKCCATKVNLEKAVGELWSDAVKEVKDNINDVMFTLDIRSAVFLNLEPKRIASVPKHSDSSDSLDEGELDVVSHGLPLKVNSSAIKTLMKLPPEKAQIFGDHKVKIGNKIVCGGNTYSCSTRCGFFNE